MDEFHLSERLIGVEGFTAGFEDEDEGIGASEAAEAVEGFVGSDDVVALGLRPETREVSVGNEGVRGAGSVGAVFEILAAAIEEKGGAVGVKDDGGESVVVVLDDEVADGRVEQGVGEGAGGHVGVENDESEARGLEEDDHHEGGGEEGALAAGAEGAEGADEEGDGGDGEGDTEIRERVEGQVGHVAEGEFVVGGMGDEGLGDVAGGGDVADVGEDGEGGDGADGGDEAECARAVTDEGAAWRGGGFGVEGHGAAEEESEGGVAGHRVVLLRGGEGEEDEDDAGPTEGEEASASGTAGLDGVGGGGVRRASGVVVGSGFEGKFGDGREVDRPGKEPDKMKQPEEAARDGVVVARVAEIEEAEKLFIDEVEPEEAVILPGSTVETEGEVRRIAEGGEDVPGRGDEKNDKRSGERVEAFPDCAREELVREEEIGKGGADGEDEGDEAF